MAIQRPPSKTLACNIGSLSDFGYMKDLPEIMYRLLNGSDLWNKRKFWKKSSSILSRGVQDEWNQRKFGKRSRSSLWNAFEAWKF